MRKLRSFLATHYRLPIITGISVHLIWGISLIARPESAGLAVIGGLDQFLQLGMNATTLGMMLILFGMLAIVGLVKEYNLSPRASFLFVMPQYLIMMLAFLSDVQVLISGENPSTGESINRILILVILWPIMAISLGHTWAVLERWALIGRETAPLELGTEEDGI